MSKKPRIFNSTGVDHAIQQPAYSEMIKAIWEPELKRQLEDGMKWHSMFGGEAPIDTRNWWEKKRDTLRRKFWRKMHKIVDKHNGCDRFDY